VGSFSLTAPAVTVGRLQPFMIFRNCLCVPVPVRPRGLIPATFEQQKRQIEQQPGEKRTVREEVDFYNLCIK